MVIEKKLDPPDHEYPSRYQLGFARSGILLFILFAGISAAAFWGGASTGAPAPENPHGDLDIECAFCHSADAWSPARISSDFDHSKYGFELVGAHSQTPCTSCHVSLDFGREAAACMDCHQDIHGGEFGMDCTECHTPRSFNDRSRMEEQHQVSRFPLFGIHATLDCESCHSSGGAGNLSFVNQSTECSACHLAEFQSTTDPDHARAGFSLDCSACHGPTAWDVADFDHNATGFPLLGGHRGVACEDCHIGGSYKDADPFCASCHQTDYDDTTNPDHFAAGYPLDCASCHSIQGWEGAAFDHNATDFPLTGAHIVAQCLSCHGDGVYNGKPTECAICHQTDYDNTTDPDHFAAGFVLDCASCHNTSGWDGATFDHSGTDFPLTGAHVTALCQSCHGDGVYNGKPTECAICHQTDYDNTTDPDHFAAGFPSNCESCHNTQAWEGATFDHDGLYFPVYSGRHGGLWNDCAECHFDPQNFTDFTCFNCHPHSDENKTNGNHSGQAGYVYDSLACYNCHPNGTH